MHQYTTIDSLRAALAPHRNAAAHIGFVPTMGNLHEGHLKLIRACRETCDVSVVSIFVNPLQFAVGEDLDNYPRTLDADVAKLTEAGADFLFAPGDRELYPDGRSRQTRIVVPGLSELLCARQRPGHFDGVATVVLKLFNIVQPSHAFFGEKDYQQLTLLKTMVRHLDVPVQIRGIATERAPSGLALSSRNQYLTQAENNIAPVLYRTLREVADRVEGGSRSFPELEQFALHELTRAGFEPEYCEIRNADDLSEPASEHSRLVVLAAARLGAARLIDNIRIEVEPTP